MPKGVEHLFNHDFDRHIFSITTSTATSAVPDSLMPKGVEHKARYSIYSRTIKVPDSLMPKGVEHPRNPSR